MIIFFLEYSLIIFVGEHSFNKLRIFDKKCPISLKLELEIISHVEIRIHINLKYIRDCIVPELIRDGDGSIHCFMFDKDGP